MDDKECIALMKADDTRGLLILIDRYGRYTGKILYSFLGSGLSAQDLEEITSDVFFQLWQHRSRLDEKESLKGYISAIAKNTGRKRLRRLKEVGPLPDDLELESPEPTPQETVELSERERWAGDIMSSLDKTDRQIFYRHYYMGQTAAEIAKLMNINRSTVLSRLSRGRRTIKNRFGGAANGYGFGSCKNADIE